MKDFRQRAFVGLVGLASAGLISFGVACSSSNDGGGTGGSHGTGGSPATTGSGGSGTGGSGTGGSAGAAMACNGGVTTPPAADLITDFSDVPADAGSSITFGSTGTVMGGVATFQNAASSPGTASVTGGALTYSATVSMAGTGGDMYPYSGVVVYINGPACVDASQYSGVSFSIKGDLGTCGLVFSFNDAEHGVATTSSTGEVRATGPSGSYSPQKAITTVGSTAATVMVAWADPTGGSPATPVDPKNLTSVQWQLTNSSTSTAPCTASITVDDIKFYK
ncbi:MAG TPA: hypothetical protein VN962_15550 [Polyangia bacterium]|nr:hypothetical protein [Polyangia bacterium]